MAFTNELTSVTTAQETQGIPVALIYSYPLHIGGVETLLLALLRHHDPARFRYFVYAPASPEFTRAAQALHATVVQWQPRSPMDVRAAWQLMRQLRRQGIRVAHFHCPRSALLVRPLTYWAGLRTVVSVQLPAYYFVESRWTRAGVGRWLYLKLERWLNCHCTDHLIYASTLVMREAEDLGLLRRETASYIGNGVELARFQDSAARAPLRAQLGAPADETVLLSVCRLEEQKGVEVLLRAFAEVSNNAVWLWIAGDGPLRAELETLAQTLGIAPRVRFLGYRRDVPQLLQAADIFVLASRYEAMPLSILEALAAGLPCVVTDTGENALLIEDGVHGHVVPINQPETLAAALRQLLQAPEQRHAMARAARDKAAQYSDEQTARRITAVYEQVLTNDDSL